MAVLDWTAIIFGMGVLILTTIILVVVIWQGFATWRARMSVAREEAYRTLAEQTASAQQRTAVQQQQIAAELGELRARVAAIETLLREVG